MEVNKHVKRDKWLLIFKVLGGGNNDLAYDYAQNQFEYNVYFSNELCLIFYTNLFLTLR